MWLDQLPDPRDPKRIVYSLRHEVFAGLLMFLNGCGSRDQYDGDRHSSAFLPNLLDMSGTNEPLTASSHAMNYLMEIMDPAKGMDALAGKMTYRLIRNHALDDHRTLGNEFMLAVDGVHIYTAKGRLPNAVYKEIEGKTHSVFSALEAKIVTYDGMGFSLGARFIENEERYVKQDCERKAFYHLAKTLKKRFPRLPLCLLLDGLYPSKQVLDICEKNRWSYYMTLKDGVIPKLSAAAMTQISKKPKQSVDHSPEPGVFQRISWALNLDHEGRTTHVLICEETTLESREIKKKTFVWLTNARPNHKNAARLVREARCRWVVEEAFNFQKNNGELELEHVYGRVGFAMKNYYHLLQVAHTLLQLMIRGDLFPKLQRKHIQWNFGQFPEQVKAMLALVATTTLKHYKTMKNLIRRVAESFRTERFSALATDPTALGTIQIRLNTC